jgi:spermidine/putrescine transport system ATP-binding protein
VTGSSRPAIEFRRVGKRFGPHVAVDAISFEVVDGEFFSLLGPSGCGKTTTLRLTAGFDQPDPGGEILIQGQSVAGKRPYERGLGMVFQSYALFPHLTVAGNVAFGLERHRVSKAEIGPRVRRALELVRLDPDRFGGRSAKQLSGGQRQRVALARALVLEPRILLLDEPLGALDLKLRKEMQLELKALNRSLGITFVYVTHDQEEALAMSDRIAVMDQGRIAQLGPPAEIYENPRTEFVATFIGEANLLRGTAAGVHDGRLLIERPDRSFLAPPDRRCAPGEPVTVAVRPEWMDLFRPGEVPSGENALPGTVREVVYLGETIHVLVSLASGESVRVALRNEGQLTRPIAWTRGTVVEVGWLPEDAQTLEPST